MTGRTSTLSVTEYYRLPAVRERIREYCGGGGTRSLTCASLACTVEAGPLGIWERVPQQPPESLDALLESGGDLARSLWDSASLLVHLDLDYLNVDLPGEAFVHPFETFFKLEPSYRATIDALDRFELPLLAVMTGEGYHFTGSIPLGDPVVHALASLAPETPAWLASLPERRPTWQADAMDAPHARSYVGLGLVIEHLAHEIMRRAAPRSLIPVVVNGTIVGDGAVGRECVSLDLSYAGDPLDVRHIRVAFGAYQKHRLRADMVGEAAAGLPVLVALPRGRENLCTVLEAGRELDQAACRATTGSAVIPTVAPGVARLVDAYRDSPLARFHRAYYATSPHPAAAWPETYDRLDPSALLPCVAWPLTEPNDRLLQPAPIQHLTRFLMSRGWHPRHVAGVVYSRYARDHGWGDRWTHVDPWTRADFDVRVFAGMLATGLDCGVDFNCRSAQEKGLCPGGRCHHDLRQDRERLLSRLIEPGR
jgi:hypothetical protein